MLNRDQSFPWVGLLTIAVLIFLSVTSEFLPTGLLPEIADELRVSESQVGLLVTLFAGTVVLSAAPLTALTRNVSRKSLVIAVLVVFALANVAAALAPSYAMLAVARVLGGLAHGLFWAVVSAYVVHLVPAHRVGRAVAITSSGGTAAFILGIPLGTALGHAVGWRVAFGVIAAIIVVFTLVTARFLPAVDHRERLATGEVPLPLRHDRTIAPVALLCSVVLIVMFAHYVFTTYIAPFLIGPMGFGSEGVAGMLFLYGGAGAVGLVLAGVFSDRFPRFGFIAAIGAVAASVFVLGLAPGIPWIAVPMFVLWAVAFGGAPAMLQTALLRTASPRIRDVAAASLTTAFNVGIGGGALVGGVLLDQVGLLVLPFADAALTAVGIAVALVGGAVLRRRDR